MALMAVTISGGFNTCSSCEEQLGGFGGFIRTLAGFQYMLLLRGATPPPPSRPLRHSFNTCSSCEEQHYLIAMRKPGENVSIHAPLARSNWAFHLPLILRQFQYMLLLRGATIRRRSSATWRGRFNTCSSCEEQRRRSTAPYGVTSFNTCSSCEEQRSDGWNSGEL